jgi:NAD-dependent deacetylase
MFVTEEFKQILKQAKNVFVLTGAGVSKASGLDTFRDVDGYWAKYNPMELASLEGFFDNPHLVWQWYLERRAKASAASPNAGHLALAELENLYPVFDLFTQNVDRLHHRAGNKNIYELHGNIFENHCLTCGLPYFEDINIEIAIPHCKSCGGLIRPSVVWFGEELPADILSLSFTKAQHCDLFFAIGTSAKVYPAHNCLYYALNNGAYVVEINPNETPSTKFANISFRESSNTILPEIVKLIKELKNYD